jgi:tripartite ATP-independent transporter DctM subunit
MERSAQLGVAGKQHQGVLSRGFARCDWALGRLVEFTAAFLVLGEVAVLSAGVVARYGFARPLSWSDELASSLFLWLAMLGAVLALRRGEHMRLAAISAVLSPQARHRTELAVSTIVALVALVLLIPAWQYVKDQLPITTASLEISDAWRGAALPVACGLMLWTALARLFAQARLEEALAILLILLVSAALLGWLRPVIVQAGNWNLVIFFVVLLGTAVALGVPIAFSFGAATLAYLVLATHAPLTIVVSRMDEGTSTLILLSVPLFILLGGLIEMTGLARALVAFLADLLGHVRGGLSYVLLAAMYLVSGISGSKAADMAAIAPALFPAMRERGARPGELVALLAASGAMSETIAPSLVLITIGSVCGVSIAALFTAGLVPAAVCALALGLIVRVRNPREHATASRPVTRGQLFRSVLWALPALALPVLIRLAVVRGVATATEVSTIGIAYTVLAGLVIYRSFPLKRLPEILIETAALSGAILFIIGTATAMAWALTQSGFSRQLAHGMAAMPGGAIGFLLISALAFAILGSVLEGIPAIVLFGPLLFPVARELGISDVHYAMTVVIAMGLGLFAPPLGVGFYAACAIGKSDPALAVRAIWPYLGALAAALLVIISVPWLSTGLL